MAGATRELVDMFLPVSGAVADGNRLAEDRLPHRVIPNFIPDEISTSVGEPRRLDELPAPGYLLFVGAFARRKGVHILLDAYRAMESPPPLVMIGYRSSDVIESLASPPPGVLVFTDWPADAVAEAWRRASLGIVPSTWADPCPTVAIEAMAAGKPLVASALGGLVDLVDHGQTGWLVGPGDPGALAAALQLALDDPGQVAEMGAAAARKSVAFRASEVITRIEGVYRELLDARRGLDGVNGSGS
jgi:glycosyltransferase involved in cell wall biosynthesis